MDWISIFSVNVGALSNADKIDAWAAISQTAAAILSLTALMLSLWVFSRQQRLNRWQLRLHREDHIIAWSQACITLMAEVEEYLKLHPHGAAEAIPPNDYVRIRSKLSALIDEGRLYFPNLRDPNHGALKHEAYKGHRQGILDGLVEAYDFLRLMQENRLATGGGEQPPGDAFNAIRRSFVSAAQSAIDPRLFNRISA